MAQCSSDSLLKPLPRTPTQLLCLSAECARNHGIKVSCLGVVEQRKPLIHLQTPRLIPFLSAY